LCIFKLPKLNESFELESSKKLKILFGAADNYSFFGVNELLHNVLDGVEAINFFKECLTVGVALI